MFCGLGGWTDGLIAAGYDVYGFDIQRHEYTRHIQRPGNPTETVIDRYPAQLILQDALTIHGSQFRNADLIVCSPPCQQYSWLAMPWSRSADPENSKAAKALRRKWETEGPDNRLFDACFRIQREACEAAGRRYIPMIVENVRGAQPWVGKSKANYGSFHLWGDVAMVGNRVVAMRDGKPVDAGIRPQCRTGADGQKTLGHVNKRDGHGHTRHLTNQAESDAVRNSPEIPDGSKVGGDWFRDPICHSRHGSGSSARKAASAMIAKIPLPLSTYIAQAFRPIIKA